MGSVNWEALKTASESMKTKATKLVQDTDAIVALVGTEEGKATPTATKQKWTDVKDILTKQLRQFAQDAADASTALFSIANEKKDEREGEAKSKFNAANDAGNKEKGTAKKTITESALEKLEGVTSADDVLDKLDKLQELWTQFRVQAGKAKAALGITDTAPSAQPPAPAAQTNAANSAKKAIGDARKALDEAEAESKKITDAAASAKLDDVKQAAKNAAAKAKAAKDFLATALDEAINAEKATSGQEKTDWGTAKNELTELTKPNGPVDTAATKTSTEADAVGRAAKVEDAKAAWKDSAGLLKTAKEKMDTSALKKLAPSERPLSVQPAPPDQKTEADKAKEAIGAAKSALEEADIESKKITDAAASAKLADVQQAAKNAAGKAKTAKDFLATALTAAGNAKDKATGEEKTNWETAIAELTTAKNAAEAAAAKAESEEAAVKSANTVADAKSAWKDSAGLLKTAKEKMDTSALKKLVPPGTTTTTTTTTTPSTTSKDQEKRKTAGAFGVSITAEYSKKFSLETKMHSEIKVTMVPYPAPALFIDWIKDHFQQVKKEREEAKS